MATFTYKARSAQEPEIDGVLEAESMDAAVRALSRRGYFPVSLRKRADASSPTSTAGGHRAIPVVERSACLRQLSDLLEAGLPLASVLEMAADQTVHARLKTILLTMSSGVREGKTLSRLMTEYPDVFPPYYTQLVLAGETGGMLARVLCRLADHAEKEAEIRSDTRAALAYPAFIVAVGVLTIAFLLGAIIPRLASLFADFQQRLPLPTRLLLELSSFFRRDGWLLLPALLAGALALRRWQVRGAWARRRDRWILKTPGLGRWAAHQELAQIARTLGSLLENGVPILSAIQVSAQTLTNVFYREAVGALIGPVRDGKSFSQSLRMQPIFPPYFFNLAAVGEEGGKLDQALLKVAATYERNAKREMKVAMSLLEPALILVVGLILGGVVISIMLPIFEINTLIH